MALLFTRRAARAALVLLHGVVCWSALTGAADELELDPADADLDEVRSLAEELPPGDEGPDDAEFLDPDAAKFETEWPSDTMSLYGDESDDDVRPFDWMRKWGFRHSSTEGRFADKSVPLMYSSWLNRPYHVDWFMGPMLSDNPVSGRIDQGNDLFGGLRVGWDFDYYWGTEWRFGWASPDLFVEGESNPLEGDYFVSDVSFLYYPWGDTKVRPYLQAGLGVTQLDLLTEDGAPQQATLLGMPLGVGLEFSQNPWLAWRLEVVDNLAFGGDGVDTLNNFVFTAGMNLRLGARPNSYWPWRSSRTVW